MPAMLAAIATLGRIRAQERERLAALEAMSVCFATPLFADDLPVLFAARVRRKALSLSAGLVPHLESLSAMLAAIEAVAPTTGR
jgi:hypothetical protein